jgi:hypothetical protein
MTTDLHFRVHLECHSLDRRILSDPKKFSNRKCREKHAVHALYLCKGKPTWRKIYRKYISSNTSTCFGRIHRPSSGGTPYVYNNWYLLFFLDDCQLSWLRWDCQLSWLGSYPARTTDNHLKRTVSTNCCKHSVYLPMMDGGYVRNM